MRGLLAHKQQRIKTTPAIPHLERVQGVAGTVERWGHHCRCLFWRYRRSPSLLSVGTVVVRRPFVAVVYRCSPSLTSLIVVTIDDGQQQGGGGGRCRYQHSMSNGSQAGWWAVSEPPCHLFIVLAVLGLGLS